MGASPGAALALTRMNAGIDVREVLPTVRVPTLVLHRTGDRCLRVEEGRYVASRIPGARLVALPGEDHLPFVGDQDAIVNEIEAFLTGFHPGLERELVLATVLVGLTRAPVDATPDALERLQRLNAFARPEVEHFRGTALEVNDGRLRAAFDGPARAIRCAVAIAITARRLDLQWKAGLDTGQCLQAADSVSGPAAERAAIVAEAALDGCVLVSRQVYDLVPGAGVQFAKAATVDAPPPGPIQTYAVDAASVLCPSRRRTAWSEKWMADAAGLR
jgi:hypothetical protein